MMTKKRKILLRLAALVLLLSSLLLVPVQGSEQFFSGAAEEYYQELLAAGFPDAYAKELTELHLLHPTWSFTPLLISETNEKYTWQYVLMKENEEPDNNLIGASDSYRPYRHPTNTDKFDSGSYQVSDEALAYFMDPRNFLNETDIFQFFDLSGTSASIDAVRAVLLGTFMEDETLENGKTYADYIYETGLALGVNPVYLAVKIRQEMGVKGSSPVISGSCGTLLASYYRDNVQVSESGTSVLTPSEGYTEEELLSLDGYYNYFNISASGNGTFTIYYKAMNAAVRGTAAMTEAWGGSPSWDTRWKAIYGGAYVVKTRYVDAYKPTVYLQKFNVDGRASDNFWGQYAQTVTASLSESRTLYQAFAANGALDGECEFLIPVFEGMPSSPSADPAKGNCSSTAPATSKYDFSITLETPASFYEKNEPIYTNVEMPIGTEFHFAGKVTHSYGLAGLEYSWDGGEWIPLSPEESFDFSLYADLSEVGEHILLLRGRAAFDVADSTKKNSYNVLFAVFYVQVTPPPTVYLTVNVGKDSNAYPFYAGTEIELPSCDENGFAGWVGSDGSFLPADAQLIIREDLGFDALFLDLSYLNGAAVSTTSDTHLRFSAVMSHESQERISALPAGAVDLYATIYRDTERISTVSARTLPLTATDGREMLRLFADTERLTDAELSTPYAMHFFLRLNYTDGTHASLYATGMPSLRSAVDVAQMALEDPYVTYSDEVLRQLHSIVSAANHQERT